MANPSTFLSEHHQKINALRFCLLVLLCFNCPVKAEERTAEGYHYQAVNRLVVQHDPSMPIAIGCLVVKQAGLIKIREMLENYGKENALGKSWNATASEWLEAEKELIIILDEQIGLLVRDPTWFKTALYDLFVERLSAEEADEIASHFQTPTGTIQREIIDMSMIAETLQLAYTISRTIKPNIAGSEREYDELQKVWWAARPTFAARANIYKDPAVRRFAGQETGRKYGRLIAMQGIGAIMEYMREVVAEIEKKMEQSTFVIEPIVRKFRETSIRR